MKNLLLVLLVLPLVSFGQQCISGNCVNGQGSYTWASGHKYVGEWKDGKKHGQGTYTYADGTIEKGLWENDQYVGE
jgi:hypothetical protein